MMKIATAIMYEGCIGTPKSFPLKQKKLVKKFPLKIFTWRNY